VAVDTGLSTTEAAARLAKNGPNALAAEASAPGWKRFLAQYKSFEYCRARDAMLDATDTGWAPWFIVDNNDKKRGRLNIISHLLSQIPYEAPPAEEVVMPKKPTPRGYVEPDAPRNHIPTPF
jgi:hypothetical protein